MNSLFKALNDEARRHIVELLKQKNMNVGEIAEQFNITKPSIQKSFNRVYDIEISRSINAFCFI